MSMKQITVEDLGALTEQARHSTRLRLNANLHEDITDPTQRLAIAMEPGTYIRAQRHSHTWELLLPLRGRFVVLNFDEDGVVTRRCVLGEDTAVVEIPAFLWHAVLSLDAGGVIFEVKRGPYEPVAGDNHAAWSPADNDPGVERVMAWYATARVGDRYLPGRPLI
jgi:cupin fold WbuC family metalloprotein